jgi:hypothetical protein
VAVPAGVEVSVVIPDTMATGRVSLKPCGPVCIAIAIQPTTSFGRRSSRLDFAGMKTRHLLGKPYK